MSKQSRVWAVGDLEPAKDLIDALPLLAGPLKEEARLLGLVRTFAVGVTIPDNEEPRLVGAFFTGAPAATQELRKYLDAVKLPGARSQSVATPPAEIEAAEAQWVTWQVRADAGTLRELFDKSPFAARKEQRP